MTEPAKQYGLKEAAEQIGCSKSTVQRHAVRLGLGKMIGNQRVVTDADIATIKGEIKPGRGNPEFGVKYKGGGRGKKAEVPAKSKRKRSD